MKVRINAGRPRATFASDISSPAEIELRLFAGS